MLLAGGGHGSMVVTQGGRLMPDRYVEVTRRGFGQNLMNSIFGVFVGIVLFILSFPVLWWNQGRTNLGKVAETSIPVTSVEAANDGQLVAAAGTLTVDGQLGDDPYLDPGDYVVISRESQMYPGWNTRRAGPRTKSAAARKRSRPTSTRKNGRAVRNRPRASGTPRATTTRR